MTIEGQQQQGQPAGTPAGAGTNIGQPSPGVQGGQPATNTQSTQPRRTMAGDLGDEALAQRLARTKEQTRKEVLGQLKELTGVDDLNQLKTLWEERGQLATKEQERRRAEMSEAEKLKADLAAERARREQLEQQHRQLQQEREYEQRDRQVQQLASQHVADVAVKLARVEFAEHLRGLPPDQVRRYEKNPKLAEIWFKGWAKKHPQFAAGAMQQTQVTDPAATQQQTRTQTTQPVRRTITNGTAPRRAGMAQPTGQRPDPTMGINGKTVRPGRANSMSPAEVREFARKHNITYPS